MSYQTYLFDFDYTLADSSKGILLCFHHVLSLHHFPIPDDKTIKNTIGMSLESAFSLLTGIKDPIVLHKLRGDFAHKADEVMVENTFLFPEVIPLLTALKTRGKQIAIISNKYRYRILSTLEKANITSLVDLVVGTEDILQAKPDPEGVFFALDKLHAVPEETLYIGDSLVDARTAQNSGIDFAAVLTGTTSIKQFQLAPFLRIMKNLSELLTSH